MTGIAGLTTSNMANAFQGTVNSCNRTPDAVHVAAGYDLGGTSETTSRGWYKVNGCSCRKIISAELRATEIFLLATRSGVDNVLRDGRAQLCVHATDGFLFRAENASQSRCNAAGGTWATFKFYDMGSDPELTVNIRRPNSCNL